jgi:uncharacterized membrane protein YhhN
MAFTITELLVAVNKITALTNRARSVSTHAVPSSTPASTSDLHARARVTYRAGTNSPIVSDMLASWGLMAALVSALLFALAKRSRAHLEWIIKPAAALLFVVTGARAGAFETTWGAVLFAGLVLAAIGDVLLIPKSRRAFLAGLVSFLFGHLAYALAFGLRGVDMGWLCVASAVCAACAIPVLRWLWPHVDRPMRAPVAAYIIAITTMVALAAGTVGAHGNPWILVGALGFYLSDLFVARDRFVTSSFNNRMYGLPLYFFSQLLLATTLGAP